MATIINQWQEGEKELGEVVYDYRQPDAGSRDGAGYLWPV